MSVTAYLREHLETLAMLAKSGSDEEEPTRWRIYQSDRRAQPDGDPAYTGTGEKPWWKDNHPLWLVPLSASAKQIAKERFEAQQSEVNESDVESIDQHQIPFERILLYLDRKPYPGPDPRESAKPFRIPIRCRVTHRRASFWAMVSIGLRG